MTIEQAKQIYLSVVPLSSENDFFLDDWKDIQREIDAVVSAKTIADAVVHISYWQQAEECAKAIRREWEYMNKRNYIPSRELREFIQASNAIEGIVREPSDAEVAEMQRFLALPAITIDELVKFVSVYQPEARLREQAGMNVSVGQHLPPKGGPRIRVELQELLLRTDLSAYARHVRYESLHPFTDCNGRSGRALWLWDMKGKAPLGFLHTWYYQSLDASRA